MRFHLLNTSRFISSRVRTARASVFVLTLFGIFGVLRTARAVSILTDPIDWILLNVVGTVLTWLIQLVGKLMNVVAGVLIEVLKYNGFIYSQIVTVGWEIVRDVSNLFFVLLLIAIALGTILNLENYNYRRALPRLVFMAILINFSKTISGIIIDFSQVLVHQFANVLSQFGVQQLYLSFGIERLFTISQGFDIVQATEKGGLSALDVATGLAVGLIFLTIAFVVIAVYLVIFLFRIAGLWLLIVLSPLAYLFSSFPGGKLRGLAGEWWNKFLCYCFIGPAIMFFLWLALITSTKDLELNVKAQAGFTGGLASAITEPQNLARFIITTLLLTAGLVVGRRMGCSAGDLAGAALGRMQRMAKTAALAPVRLARSGAITGIFFAGRQADQLIVRPVTKGLAKGVTYLWKPWELFRTRQRKKAEKEVQEKVKLGLQQVETQKKLDLSPVEGKIHEIEEEKKRRMEREGVLAGEESIQHRREVARNKFAMETTTAKEYQKEMEDIEKDEKELLTRKQTIEEHFRPRLEEAQAEKTKVESDSAKEKTRVEMEGVKEQVRLAKKYRFRYGPIRKGFLRASETGITGNYRLWRAGWNAYRQDRIHDYEVGKEGDVVDVLNAYTPLAQKRTTRGFMERRRYQNQKEKELLEETGGKTEAGQEKLNDALQANNIGEFWGALSALAKNTDLNEVFRAEFKEIYRPVVEDALRRYHLGTAVLGPDGKEVRKVNENDIREMMELYDRQGTLRGEYLREFLRYIGEERFGQGTDEVARLMSQLDDITLAQGQPLMWGSIRYNAEKRENDFHPVEVRQDVSGKIQVQFNDETRAGLAGKIKNMATEGFLRRLHPGLMAYEDEGGLMHGMSAMGREILLKDLNDVWLKVVAERAYGLRPDFLSKLLESDVFIRDFEKLAEELKGLSVLTDEYKKYFKTVEGAREQGERMTKLLATMNASFRKYKPK